MVRDQKYYTTDPPVPYTNLGVDFLGRDTINFKENNMFSRILDRVICVTMTTILFLCMYAMLGWMVYDATGKLLPGFSIG